MIELLISIGIVVGLCVVFFGLLYVGNCLAGNIPLWPCAEERALVDLWVADIRSGGSPSVCEKGMSEWSVWRVRREQRKAKLRRDADSAREAFHKRYAE